MQFVQPFREIKTIENMKKNLRAKSMRDYVLFTLGINSGLPISDLLRLQFHDVTDQAGQFKAKISVKEDKTGKQRDFLLDEFSAKALEEYLVNLQPDDYLFPSRKGDRPITRHQAWRMLNVAAKSIGIKDKIGTHSLRKTFGYHLYKSGVHINRIMAMLNHSSAHETLRYIGIMEDDEVDKTYVLLNL